MRDSACGDGKRGILVIHNRLGPLARALVVAFVGLALSAPAAFAVTYGPFSGDNVDFVTVTETTQTPGDPAVLFGAPMVAGDQLIFFPPAFSATSANGVSDSTLSQLQADIVATTPGFAIESLRIQEFGDTVLSGTGSTTTKTELALSGFHPVLAYRKPK